MSLATVPYNAEHLDYDEAEHPARLIIGDDKAMAWAWIWSYAKNLSSGENPDPDDYRFEYDGTITPNELIETALSNLENDSKWGGDYINKGPLLDGLYVDDIFWDKLAILKELEIPQSKRDNFFSCSC